jgi:2-oxoisovalerate dehydrogenase E1 component beta subunit
MSQPVLHHLREALAEAFGRDQDLRVVGENVRRTSDLTAALVASFPDRVIETPVAERGTLGMAVGMALTGRRTVVEITSTGRLFTCMEVLAEAADIARAGEFSVPLVVFVPTGGQAGAVLDRSAADALTSLPGLRVTAPGTANGLISAWTEALGSTAPRVLFAARTLLTERCTVGEPVTGGSVLRAGEDITLISWGSGTAVAMEAAARLDREGTSAQVVDLHHLAPLDLAPIAACVRATGRAIVVHPPEGGLDDRILRSVIDGAFLYLESPLTSSEARIDDVVAHAHRAVTF